MFVFVVSCTPSEEALAGEAIKKSLPSKGPETVKGIDLVVSFLQADSKIVVENASGKYAEYTFGIKNRGIVASPEFKYAGLLYPNILISANVEDILEYLPALKSGESATLTGLYAFKTKLGEVRSKW